MIAILNSPFIDGKLTKFQSYRSYIWTKTDDRRTGLLKFIYNDDFSLKITDYLLDVPMYFIIRNNKYIDLTGLTFRDYLKSDIHNPCLEDWKIHSTTVFQRLGLNLLLRLEGLMGAHGQEFVLCLLFGLVFYTMRKF